MTITISSDDEFTYVTPDLLPTALAGQTVSYETVSINDQSVTNGFDYISGTSLELPNLSESLVALEASLVSIDFIEEVFAATGIDNPNLIEAATDVFGNEAERLVFEIFSDEGATQATIRAMDEIFAGIPLGSVSGLINETRNDDDTPDLVAMLTVINQFANKINSRSGLSIEINAEDSFDFVVGATNLTKLFGQTVSYVTGENNQQTIINGFDAQEIPTGVPPSGTRAENGILDHIDERTPSSRSTAAEPRARGAYSEEVSDTHPDRFSIVIDTGDRFVFNVGDVDIVTMFGQTVTYTTGTQNVQTVTNGPVVTTGAANPATQIEADDRVVGTRSNAHSAVLKPDTDTDEDLPNILISTGDSFSFDVRDTSVTKMFGQTVSLLSGTDTTQTVANGFVVEAGQADPASSFKTPMRDVNSPNPRTAERDQDNTKTREDAGAAVNILTLVDDIGDDLEDAPEISIIIETGDSFYFDVGDTEITKMFGQTVSYVSGERNSQNVANGFEVTTVNDENRLPSSVLNPATLGLSATDFGDPMLNTIVAAELEAEAEQLLAEIASDDGVVAEVIGSLDEVFAETGLFGSVSGLIDESLKDDDSSEIATALEIIELILDASGAETDLSIVIDSGDSFAFDVKETTLTKLFGQTVSYAAGSDLEQTVTNGFQVNSLEMDAAPAQTDSDQLNNGFSVIIDSGNDFIFDVGDVEIVKMFGQTVSYVNGNNNEQMINNGFVENDNSLRMNTDSPSQSAGQSVSWAGTTSTDAMPISTNAPGTGSHGDQPTIHINSGDDFVFNVGEVDIVKMFGQTVSYASGEDNVQTVVNGSMATDMGSSESEMIDKEDRDPLFDPILLSYNDGSQLLDIAGVSEAENLDEGLALVGDIITDRDDLANVLILIESADDFTFNVGETDIVKILGQTVNYADGDNLTQRIVNGPVFDADDIWIS